MNTLRLTALALATFWIGSPAWSQQPPGPKTRDWTSVEGNRITADYLGIQDSNVVLKLPNGRISVVPLSKLSAPDNSFVEHNLVGYYPPWHGWTRDAGMLPVGLTVDEVRSASGSFIYTTQHFRFDSDVNLGTQLMKDLAKVFEQAYDLNSKSPFGILAKPRDQRFDARLFGTKNAYLKAGGREGTSGIYLLKDKVFLAPLELMGVRSGTAGWRKGSNDYDPSTIVHELTHMLTHDMLGNLPTWMNEGYAEYVSKIPIEGNEFKTGSDKIREGIRDMFIRQHEKGRTAPGGKPIRLDKAARNAYLSGTSLPALYRVEKVLQMTNEEWATGLAPVPPARTSGTTAKPSPGTGGPAGQPPLPAGIRIRSIEASDPNRLPKLYRTAHLIIYYFIQIEGEKGVLKLQRFLDANRGNLVRYQRYREDFKTYETEMAIFMKRPGVTALADGRVSYPANVQPPKAPEPPFTDPTSLQLGGLPILLGGESATVVGARIEKALKEDLGMNLRFVDKPGGW